MLRLSFKSNNKPDVELKSGRVTFGRDAANDVVLEADGVSGFHAEVHIDGERVQLVDLGSTNGSFVNGKRVSGRTQIKAWDEIRLDEVVLEVVDPQGRRPTVVRPAIGEAPAGTPAGTAKTAQRPAATQAVAAAAADEPRASLAGSLGTFPLPGNARIGRAGHNDVVINDPSVSGSHAEIRVAGSQWSIEDLGSTNGVFVNDKPVTTTALNTGDTIRLGNVELTFEGPAGAPAQGPAQGPAQTQALAQPTLSVGMTPTRPARTAARSTRSGSAWLPALLGFVVVAVAGAGVYQYRDQLFGGGAEKFRLQASRAWSVPLPNGRNNPVTPVIGEVNGDNRLDVVVADSQGRIVALDGPSAKIIFDMALAGRILAPLAIGDLDGDNVADILASTDASGGTVARVAYIGEEPKVLWKSPDTLQPGQIVNRAVLHDVNGDNIKDVLISTANRGLMALHGGFGWELWNTAEATNGALQTKPLIVDLNGDGVTDIVTVSTTGQVLAVTPTQNKWLSVWATNLDPVNYASPAFIADGSNGYIVVATQSRGVVALNAANGRIVWRAPINKEFFASPVTADANGDKVADVIVVATNGDMHVLDARTGDEIWSLALGVNVRATPAIFDANGDGLGDIVLLDEAGNLQVIDMARGRVLVRVAVVANDGFVSSPIMGDVNHDGLLEIVSASNNGVVSAYALNRRTGKGTTQWPMFLGSDSP